MMANDLRDFIKSILRDTGAQDDEINALFGLYAWNYYKAVLEILLPLKSKDPQFFIELNEVFDKAVNNLDEGKKAVYLKTLEEQKAEILKRIFNELTLKLPKETLNIIKNNLDHLSA